MSRRLDLGLVSIYSLIKMGEGDETRGTKSPSPGCRHHLTCCFRGRPISPQDDRRSKGPSTTTLLLTSHLPSRTFTSGKTRSNFKSSSERFKNGSTLGTWRPSYPKSFIPSVVQWEDEHSGVTRVLVLFNELNRTNVPGRPWWAE